MGFSTGKWEGNMLTITTTHRPANDLGFLLHKNPGRVHTTDLSFGRAHIVFEEATPQRCTAALIVEVDPVGQARDGMYAVRDSLYRHPRWGDRARIRFGHAVVLPFDSVEPGFELRPLLELPVELVLPTHGAPTDRAALERALS